MQLHRPSPGLISSYFGPRTGPGSSVHQGIDFSWSNNGVQNWNIYAAQSGVIEQTSYVSGYGNLTIINHGNGYKTWYAHQARFTRYAGQRVDAGEIIGIIGNTGASFGAHLHFELRVHGVPVDPMPYFSSTAGGGGTPIEEEEDMTTYELWKTSTTSPTVWFVVDRLFRYGIPSEMSLNDYTHFIQSKGQDATIKVGAAQSLGLPVYRDGVTVAPSDRLTQAQVTGAVRAALADFDSTTVEIDEEALAANIAAAISFPTTITGTLS